MRRQFADWVDVPAARLPSDMLAGRSVVVIPLRSAVVCADDHVYDFRQFHACPNCSSEERIPLFAILGGPKAAQPAG
jgi:hypothetical protein